MASGTQTLRFRRPDNGAPKAPSTTAPIAKQPSILQDQTRRHERPWAPSFSMAVRILLLVRFLAAMYSNISDCDEVYNFWEPLHYLDRGYGFQTWETSPVYSIRSYAYVLLHLLPVRLARLIGPEKRPAFFAVRIALAITSTICEAKFYRAVVEKVNLRVGRYLYFMLLFNAGMWSASAAFLPSSFAMYCNTLAFSYAVEPSSLGNAQRTVVATFAFAAGAIFGWPFSFAIAIPFVLEELFLRSIDRVPSEKFMGWMSKRWSRLLTAAAVAGLLFVPVIALDTVFYGRPTVTAWNIISYNILNTNSNRGPELYGTEPWYFYFLNLALSLNVLLPLALISLPALAITSVIDRRRLGLAPAKDQSSPFTVLGFRLAPVYVWLGILMAQAHKEERFVYPAYPMICFNAAVTLYLVRGWMEVAYIKATASPYRASRSSIFSIFTFSVIAYSTLISVSRIFALWYNYHAPLSVVYSLESQELPRLLNISGLLPPPPVRSAAETNRNDKYHEDSVRVDLTPIKDFDLTLCVAKEWYRFPGHYLVPEGVHVEFVQNAFDGLVPGKFTPVAVGRPELAAVGTRAMGTRVVPQDQNDLNKAEPTHYVDVSKCDYMLDSDLPSQEPTALEPRYSADNETWERVACRPFLDAARSPTLTRTLWLPGERWREANTWGEWCLLRRAGAAGVDARVKAVGAAKKFLEKQPQ